MSSRRKTLSVRFRFDMGDPSDKSLHELLAGLKPLARGDLLKPATLEYLTGLLSGLTGGDIQRGYGNGGEGNPDKTAACPGRDRPAPKVGAGSDGGSRGRKPRPGRRPKPDNRPIGGESEAGAAVFDALTSFNTGS